MRIALCSSFVPFVGGGYRHIVDWLAQMLVDAGHQVETVWIPEVDAPSLLVQQMAAYRWIDLEAADRVICFRPQSHLIRHPRKVVWFIHHLRVFYDLWHSEYRGFPDDVEHRAIRDILHGADTEALKEAVAIFANSKVVADRLQRYNGIQAEVLYPPVFRAERFHAGAYGDTVVSVCRIERHKRIHLLVDALAASRSPVKLAIYGTSSDPGYVRQLRESVVNYGLSDRVILEDRWITEDEKVDILSSALALAYVPLDEDSYGYPVLEGAHARRPVVTTTDSGGVVEFARDEVEGFVAAPIPVALSVAFDRLHADRQLAERMGRAAELRVAELGVSWSHVLERLLA